MLSNWTGCKFCNLVKSYMALLFRLVSGSNAGLCNFVVNCRSHNLEAMG